MSTSEFSVRQYEESYPPGIEFHFWNSARNLIIAATLRRSGMAASSLLEIGCGSGVVLEHLRQSGMQCVGCDLADAPVPDRLRPFVWTRTDYRNLPLEIRGEIDGVLLCDVIEHLPDTAAFLAGLRCTLPALRRVVVTVPARKELWSSYDEYSGHYRRYTRATLNTDLRRGGLSPISSRYFFCGLYPAMLALRHHRSDTRTPPSWQLPHRVIAAAFRAEYALLPASIPGTSLIAVASV